MSLAGKIAGVFRPVRLPQTIFVQLRYSEAMAYLPHILETARMLIERRDNQFAGYSFWDARSNAAKAILREAGGAYKKHKNVWEDKPGLDGIARELTVHVQRLDNLIKKINLESDRYKVLAEGEFKAASKPIKIEISRTGPVVSNISREFGGYRFWVPLDQELDAARQLMEKGAGREGVIAAIAEKTEWIRAMREELIPAAAGIRAAERKLIELQSSYYPRTAEGNEVFKRFASIKARLMGDYYRDAVNRILDGSFEEGLKLAKAGLNNDVIKAFKVFGVTPGTPFEAVKKSYRKLIFIHHPDRNRTSEAERMAREITSAYDLIQEYFRAAQPQAPNWA